MTTEDDERAEELETLTAIYPELAIDPTNSFTATLELPVNPTSPLLVRFLPVPIADDTYASAAAKAAACIEHDVYLSYLPPVAIRMSLPKGYPADIPPTITVNTQLNWLPEDKIEELENEAANIWEEFGHCQTLFAYIDHLQQAAERGFDLEQSSEGCLVLPSDRESQLVNFDSITRQHVFDAGTFDCGVCLEPKKGSSCYQMKHCGHVFCRQCLQDFYNNAIKEGDVAGVKCMDTSHGGERKRKKERTIHPRELLAMGIEESVVRRYVDMKRKKKLEADKTTVYCPREWCQGPAKSDKYPPIPADLTSYIDNEVSEDEGEPVEQTTISEKNGKNIPPDPSERLAVCEKCSLAFCKVCYMGWHGPFARCYPRDPSELSAEEQASYDYIRKNTSPCPYCNAPVQKTMGCNHMNCFNCRTHFCYLCGSWLDAGNPYQHFNKSGTPCFQRLWELEEGDEGQRPGDGRGFVGGARHWEQMAVEAARAADEAEAEAAAEQAQAEENERAALPAVPEPPEDRAPFLVAMAHDIHLDDDRLDNVQDNMGPPAVQQRGARRPRNPFPARPVARGAAQAVRHHERARAGGGLRLPAAPRADDRRNGVDDQNQAELQRFLELARQDEEDGWNSDELGDDEEFVIPHR